MFVDSAKKALQLTEYIFRMHGKKCPDEWRAVTGTVITPERAGSTEVEVREAEWFSHSVHCQ